MRRHYPRPAHDFGHGGWPVMLRPAMDHGQHFYNGMLIALFCTNIMIFLGEAARTLSRSLTLHRLSCYEARCVRIHRLFHHSFRVFSCRIKVWHDRRGQGSLTGAGLHRAGRRSKTY